MSARLAKTNVQWVYDPHGRRLTGCGVNLLHAIDGYFRFEWPTRLFIESLTNLTCARRDKTENTYYIPPVQDFRLLSHDQHGALCGELFYESNQPLELSSVELSSDVHRELVHKMTCNLSDMSTTATNDMVELQQILQRLDEVNRKSLMAFARKLEVTHV